MACKRKYRPGKRFLWGSVISCCCSVVVGLVACGGFFLFRNLIGVNPNNGFYLPGDSQLVDYSSVISLVPRLYSRIRAWSILLTHARNYTEIYN